LFDSGSIESDRMAQYSLQQSPNSSKPVTADTSLIESLEVSSLEEAVHELRQPLSVIESLAYYLELTSNDEAASKHLRHIQAMVVQANSILAQVPLLGRC
jgi:signal transduction histidine kinase